MVDSRLSAGASASLAAGSRKISATAGRLALGSVTSMRREAPPARTPQVASGCAARAGMSPKYCSISRRASASSKSPATVSTALPGV